MEVEKREKKPLMMRDYLDQFQKRALILLAVGAIAVGSCITVLLALTQLIAFFSWQFWVILVTCALLVATINAWLYWMLSRPFKALVQTIVMISGAPTLKKPANPNDEDFANDGFKDILQTLYELATSQPEPIIDTEPKNKDPLHIGLDQTSTGIVIFNEDKQIIYSNKKAPVRINRNGDKFIDALFPDTDTLESWLADRKEKSVRSENIWTRIPNKAPGERNRRIYDVVASYQRGSSAETVVTFFDRTDTYSPEEDDLDFISFAAHELRGPITVIRGYLDVLDEELKPVLENDQTELMQRLIVSSNRLSSYINNILNASRYDRRHFKIHLTEDKLSDIYKSISDDMQLRAVSQNRILTVDIPDTLPTIAADKNSVGEVLSNLIDNAIKYSNEGGQVTIKARAISRYVEVQVIDRGIGMPSSVLPNLFHKFYRSHRSRETVAGTGIGLYISKAIVESHGGSIEVRSTESEGSTFTFTLPIYSTVAEKLKAGNNSNEALIEHGSGWIRNHSLYRG